FELNHNYHLEIAVIFDTDIPTQTYHSFNLDLLFTSFPEVFTAPFITPPGLVSISGYELGLMDPSLFDKIITGDVIDGNGEFQLIFDAMENNQVASYDKLQEMLFLQEEEISLLRIKCQLQDLKHIKKQRKDLLQDQD